MASKIPERPPVYQLKITLSGIVPPIWRRILVYGDVKLYSCIKSCKPSWAGRTIICIFSMWMM